MVIVNVSIDLAPKQLEFLEKMVDSGQYRTRSELVRDIIRRAEFEYTWRAGIAQALDKGATEDIDEAREKAFKKLGGRFKDVL